MTCYNAHCTGQHCSTCGRDIMGGYPAQDGGRVCGDCPNMMKGVYDVVVRVHATSMVRALQCVNYACADWFPKSDSNYEPACAAAVVRHHQNKGDAL